MAYIKKYTKGHRIDNVSNVVRNIRAGRYMFWGDVPKHSGFIQSMTLRTILTALNQGILFTAKENTNV